jgi:citrate lyase beta subunit
MKPRRALLFMPGDDRHKIERGAALGVDSIIMDLEDGVALNRKQQARETVAAAMREVDFGTTERLVRINPIATDGLHVADITAIIPLRPDGLVVPKVESAVQIDTVSQQLSVIEREHGWPDGAIALLPIVETALGVVNLREIASSDTRLSALIFGAEDLAGDIGARRTPDGWEVFYARSAIVIHARAFGLQAIDTIYAHLENLNGLEAETEQAVYMGFSGKLAIHPRQVEPIQAAFTPTPAEIHQAQRLIAAFNEHQAAGTGVFALDGKMVDMPMVRAAEMILARAKLAGIVVDR